jgi:hypothetical protein
MIIYRSAILFGLVYLTNFTSLDYATQFYLNPLLIGAQVYVGLVINFIRFDVWHKMGDYFSWCVDYSWYFFYESVG